MEQQILTRFSEEEADRINEALEIEKRSGANFCKIAVLEKVNKILEKNGK